MEVCVISRENCEQQALTSLWHLAKMFLNLVKPTRLSRNEVGANQRFVTLTPTRIKCSQGLLDYWATEVYTHEMSKEIPKLLNRTKYLCV